jgi:muramidase (phage lysozyme)
MRELLKYPLFIASFAGSCLVLFFIIFRMKRKQDNLNYRNTNNNIKAFLWAIRLGEGTQGENGYRTMFGGGLFDVSNGWKHPKTVVRKGGYNSSAAGAYQILTKTHNYLAVKLGTSDFTPETQDLMAIELIREKNALDDVLAGRFATAVEKVNTVWASLPGSPYGQPTVTLAQVQNSYVQAGGFIV